MSIVCTSSCFASDPSDIGVTAPHRPHGAREHLASTIPNGGIFASEVSGTDLQLSGRTALHPCCSEPREVSRRAVCASTLKSVAFRLVVVVVSHGFTDIEDPMPRTLVIIPSSLVMVSMIHLPFTHIPASDDINLRGRQGSCPYARSLTERNKTSVRNRAKEISDRRGAVMFQGLTSSFSTFVVNPACSSLLLTISVALSFLTIIPTRQTMTIYSIASLRERRCEIIDDYAARIRRCHRRYDEHRAAVVQRCQPLQDSIKSGRHVTRLNRTLIQACRDLDMLEQEDITRLKDSRSAELDLLDQSLVLPHGETEPMTFAQYEIQIRPGLVADAARRAILFSAAVNLARRNTDRATHHDLLDDWVKEFDSVNYNA